MAETGFPRPSLATLIDRIASDINTKLLGAVDARLPRSPAYVFGRALAAAFHTLYGFTAYQSRQLLPDTATGQGLRRLASIWGITPDTATQAADGRITLSGVVATAIPAGTELIRADGVLYLTDAPAVIGGAGTVAIDCTAQLAGADGNAALGVVASLISPIAGVVSAGVVSLAFTNGTDAETDESLRARILARIATPPQGGSAADYIDWALDTTGVDVRGVYVEPMALGPGTVYVRFTVAGAGAACIPGAPAIAAVQARIDASRPVTAAVTVLAPVGMPVTMSIQALPNTAAVQAAITAELDDLFAREGRPGGTIQNSWIREAISRATGETSHALTLLNGGSPSANVVQASNAVAYLSTITWI